MLNLFSHLAARAVFPRCSGRMAAMLLLTTALGACSLSELPGLYRIDIQQGNVVTQEMLAQLEPGMDKRRVRFVLGTPLVADTFNDDRWDYIYTYRTGGDDRMQRNITVFFEDERLARLEGDVERAALRPKAPEPPDTIVKVTGPREERGLFASMNPFSDTPERGEDVTEAEPDAESSTDSPLKRDAPTAGQTDETQASGQETESVVTPTGDDGQREPEALAPITALDSESDKTTIEAKASERLPDEQAARSSPPGTTSGSAVDEPSWWERVKQGVGISSDNSQPPQDRAAVEQLAPETSGRTAVTESQTAPDSAARTNEATLANDDKPAPPAASAQAPVASDDGAVTSASSDGDGGFFDRIRERFKIPELPPLPTLQAPDDAYPDVGDR